MNNEPLHNCGYLLREGVKNVTDHSISFWHPHPWSKNRFCRLLKKNHVYFIIFRYAYKKIRNGLNERSQERKKTLVRKEKYLETFQWFMKISIQISKNVQVFNRKCHKIFVQIFPFHDIQHTFLFFRNKHLFLLHPGVPPPPFKEWSVTYRFFSYTFPN